MKKKILGVFGVLLLVVLTGCGGQDKEINVSGSTSIAPLMEKLVAAYTKDNKVTINVNADGSSAGIKAASEGVSQIGMASRDLKDDEKKLGLTNDVIAKDAITIIVNKNNKVKDLSKKQIKDIFSGKIKNWSKVGGANQPITVLSREDGSGTRSAFEELFELLNIDETSMINNAKPVIANSTGAVLENVKSKDGAIGYISLGSLNDEVHSLSVDKVSPSEQTVLNNTYLVSRPFLLVSKDANEETKKFIDFIKSKEGQKIVSEEGYVKLN
ncbi:MAG: phosphate ABC transporter substrate-binding protein [Erysipelotrichales bacterium]